MDKPKSPKLVTVAIFTTITTIFWVFTGLYNIITSSPPANVDPKLLEPINPTLDKDALDRLDGRIFFEQGETTTPLINIEIPESETESEEASAVIEEGLDEEVVEETTFLPTPFE